MASAFERGGKTMPRRQRPPDYTQRSVKIRIFICVAGVMAVLWVIEHAIKPGTWEWLQGGQPTWGAFFWRSGRAGWAAG